MHFTEATFTDQEVVLDGNTYERCTFINCTLRHLGGPFQILGGFGFDGTLNFQLEGGESTVKLLDLMGRATGYIHIGGRTYRAVDEVTSDDPAARQADNGWSIPPRAE